MTKLITATLMLLLMGGTIAHAQQTDFTLHYRTPGTMWPDEMSPAGLPAAFPCSVDAVMYKLKKTVTCTWIKFARQLTWHDAERNKNMWMSNRVAGICRRGVCQSDGTRVGNIPYDTDFNLSTWYYIGQSTDGKVVAYLQGHGPAYNQPAVSYVDAGKTLVEFYEISGAQSKDIITTMDWRYEGGWKQFLADQGGESEPAGTFSDEVKEAWCNPRMDDDCSVNGKPVAKADLGKYLPTVDPDEFESNGGICEYQICYDKNHKPVGIRR